MKTATGVFAGTAAPSALASGADHVTVWPPTQRLAASTKSVYRRPVKPASTHRAPRGASAARSRPDVRSVWPLARHQRRAGPIWPGWARRVLVWRWCSTSPRRCAASPSKAYAPDCGNLPPRRATCGTVSAWPRSTHRWSFSAISKTISTTSFKSLWWVMMMDLITPIFIHYSLVVIYYSIFIIQRI